jgi:DNA polymerase III alpha subunit
MLERTKKSKDSGGGLFGDMEMHNKITFKATPEISYMKKLLLEQEVFKSFVSGHPLDGLYLHLKKYNFITQFKDKE